MIEGNLSVRELGYFMPLACLLFFGSNGCGDYYGYPITAESGVRDDNVFLWEHESDKRVLVFLYVLCVLLQKCYSGVTLR